MGKGRLQRGQRLVRVGRLEDLRGGGPGVQGAAPRSLGIRLGPLVAGALGQLAPVQGDRAAAVRRSPAMTVPPSGQQVLARMARLCTAAPTECQRPGAAHIGGSARCWPPGSTTLGDLLADGQTGVSWRSHLGRCWGQCTGPRPGLRDVGDVLDTTHQFVAVPLIQSPGLKGVDEVNGLRAPTRRRLGLGGGGEEPRSPATPAQARLHPQAPQFAAVAPGLPANAGYDRASVALLGGRAGEGAQEACAVHRRLCDPLNMRGLRQASGATRSTTSNATAVRLSARAPHAATRCGSTSSGTCRYPAAC